MSRKLLSLFVLIVALGCSEKASPPSAPPSASAHAEAPAEKPSAADVKTAEPTPSAEKSAAVVAKTDEPTPAPETANDPAAQKLHVPEKGSAERKAITDALRPSIEKDLGQPVIFVIDHLAVKAGHAFLTGRPVQPDGKAIDYKKTRYREDLEEGLFDDNVSALLRQDGGEWKLVAFSLGATDVAWLDWPQKHHAPREIFPGTFE